jgi:carboxymethylenebutenolidase
MTHTHYASIEAADGGHFDAYCAVPDRDPAPGVLLFQEIFGINDNIRGLAEKLAAAGFLVLAPDMFWRLEPRFERKDESGLADAMSMVQRLDFTLARADMAATLAQLRAMPGCTGRVGAVGFCLGGTLTFLAAATAKPDGCGLDAAVPYYGSMLLHYGDEDPYITAEQIAQVEQALADRKDVTVHHYDAGHAFSNWDAPSMYRAEPAELAWTRTLAFLAEQLS